ncbi:MAG: hypothetical protein ABIH41_05920, partial [Nanoarchaeota archaeon]
RVGVRRCCQGAGAMRQQFLEWWSRVDARGNGENQFRRVVSAYSEPHRYYHTLNHIEACLEDLALARHVAREPDALEGALWYHDVVYDPTRTDNEQRSAVAWYNMCLSAKLTEAFAEQGARLILETSEHDSGGGDGDLMVDIDLAIFGKPPRIYDAYERAIRKEYEWAPVEVFNPKRVQVLQRFASGGRVYTTDFFEDRYGTQALENLARAIEALRPTGP